MVTSPDPDDVTQNFARGSATPSGPPSRSSSPSTDTTIGSYRVLQTIGEGGMGVVYLAEQEQPVRRRVALKVIRGGLDSQQVVARFEAERQALAMMDHVNIAKILEAGTTESGRPYFAMELVPGVPITKYCDDQQWTTRQRLEVMIPVCEAIQHAHQKGIIHRDIKPSNVLVCMSDGKPIPKVIDFGVAKAIDHRLTTRTMFTEYGTVVGTLEYMAPEQAEISPLGVDTRADIYSLGVLLYELLTGSPPLNPQRIREATYTQILEWIRQEEPPRPSTRLAQAGAALATISARRRTDASRLPRVVRGELDWITLKCLEKDRTRRYESASALARDIERYLRNEPVEAGPPSTVYRLRKFAWKHRGVAATAATVLFMLVAGTVVSTLLAMNATAARRQESLARVDAERQKHVALRAEREAQNSRVAAEQAQTAAESRRREAEAVTDYLVKAFQSARADDIGADVRVVQVLERAVSDLQQNETLDDAIKARLFLAIGNAYDGLRLHDKSRPLFEKSLEICRRLYPAPAPEIRRALTALAHAQLNEARPDEALTLYEELYRLAQEHPGKGECDPLFARSNLAGAYLQAGQVDRALPLLEQAAVDTRARAGAEDRLTLIAQSNLAAAYVELDRLADAAGIFEQIVATRLAISPADSAELAVARDNLAATYAFMSRHGDESRLLELVLPVYRVRFGPESWKALETLRRLSTAHIHLEQYDEAERVLRELNDASRNANPGTVLLASDIYRLAECLMYEGRFAEVETVCRESLAVCAQTTDPMPLLVRVQLMLGTAQLKQQRPGDAEPVLRAAVDSLGPDTPYPQLLAEVLERLIETYDQLQRPDDAAQRRRQLEQLEARSN